MSYYEREQQIINILLKRQSIGNNELAKELFISTPTLRRDLDKMERKGLIVRTHGACSLNKKLADEKIPLYFREQEHNSAKIKMGKMAVNYIKNGDIIMMDSSTSAYNIVPFLKGFSDVIVITNGAKTSHTLGTMSIKNISTGGHMITESLSYVGPEAMYAVQRYNADVFFFSCRGVSDDGWLTDTSVEENELRREMMKRAKKKVFLCDSSKFGQGCFNNLCHISDIDEIICDESLPEHILRFRNGRK